MSSDPRSFQLFNDVDRTEEWTELSSCFCFWFMVLLTTMTWLCHVLGPRVMVRAVSALRHLRFGTCCHRISRTVMLVANSSSRALRLGSLCKPTHKRRLWELCLSSALQILDLIDWLIDNKYGIFVFWSKVTTLFCIYFSFSVIMTKTEN